MNLTICSRRRGFHCSALDSKDGGGGVGGCMSLAMTFGAATHFCAHAQQPDHSKESHGGGSHPAARSDRNPDLAALMPAHTRVRQPRPSILHTLLHDKAG